MSEVLAETMARLDEQTGLLLRSSADLRPQDLDHPSLCRGWSRAHVLAHLARNADSLTNLVRWAHDGLERPAYHSAAVRESDIATGAKQPLEVLLADVRGAAEAFRRVCGLLPGAAEDAMVRTRQGAAVSGRQMVAMRLAEVVLHHADLDTGFSLDQVGESWLERTLRRGVRTWEASGSPGLTLVATSGQVVELGGGGSRVRGSLGALLLWRARGVVRGLETDAPLPVPPPWA